jgi:hypothetical protein|tara:strand:- start:11151 stop:11393 length:243 start_codon:yes stop_codon:yes gene_type:complete
MENSPNELRESIIDKIMTLVSSGNKIRPGIRKMINKDPELNKKFKDIEKDLQDLGKQTKKLASKVEKKYKGTPLEKFFSV